MILGFSNKETTDIFNGESSRHTRKIPLNLQDKARRLLDQINAAYELKDLRSPPGNRLEALKGDLKGKWSIRINDQWRIIFEWQESNALQVGIVDYH